VNYQLGLTWARNPGFRGVYHFNDNKVSFGMALENSEPYVGAGTEAARSWVRPRFSGTPKCGLGRSSGRSDQQRSQRHQLGGAASGYHRPNWLRSDPKAALRVSRREITNKIANPVSTPAFQTSTKAGGGGSVNLNFEVVKGLRIVTNNFWSDGAGRYIFGQAPDFMIRADGSIGLVHSGSTVSGFEANVGNTLFYGYYGGVYIGKSLARDANGTTLIGYGPISSDGQNRAIQEITFGTNTTLMKDAKWGALNLMFSIRTCSGIRGWLPVRRPSSASLSMGSSTYGTRFRAQWRPASRASSYVSRNCNGSVTNGCHT